MATNIVIPESGESVTHGVIVAWRKNDGDYVQRDEVLLDLETDKITVELPAPAAGVIRHSRKVGDKVAVGETVGTIDESAAAPASKPTAAPAQPATTAASATGNGSARPVTTTAPSSASVATDVRATPLARKVAQEHGVDLARIQATGAGGKVRQDDVMHAVGGSGGGGGTSKAGNGAIATVSNAAGAPTQSPTPVRTGGVRREPMSMLRQRVAARLVEAQHTAAMLTTFNECDMTAVIDLRKKYKEDFEKRHGVGLGFMSFFVKAAANALRSFPMVNASIVQTPKGELEIEHHDSCDIALAVGTPKGLVVPVLRGCEHLSFAQVEGGVKELAGKARDGKLTLKDLQGGTFTITNGGIYGSLMSTPILNPPQTGILGMHAIKNRAVEDPTRPGQVAIRPMMYLALSYDHRLVDGSEAVQFLVAIKNAIESPERMMLGM